jgi:hypothetical protein
MGKKRKPHEERKAEDYREAADDLIAKEVRTRR